MPGSTSAQLLPDGGSLRSRAVGPVAHGAAAAERTPASESPIEPPLLRDLDRGLAAAGVQECPQDDVIDTEAIDAIVAQLAPISTRSSLLSSFEREANPADARVRAAYARAWMRLPQSGARRRTRRARIAASMLVGRRGR